jgi:HEAT repeats
MLLTHRLAIALAACTACLGARPLAADLVKLKSGGELRGQLEGHVSLKGRKPVVVTTVAGGVVAVEAVSVQFVTRRPFKVELYETRAKGTPRTVAAQWEFAEWCRRQGLTSQREDHLRILLELAPNHRRARLALGYGKYDGKWMTRDEWNRSRGLVKYKGKYITPEELELIKKSDAELEREITWHRKVKTWKNWLSNRYAIRRAEGLKNLQKLTDPDAVPALSKNFSDESNRAMRALYVRLLSKLKGAKPVAALVHQTLYDTDYEIRYAALNGISKDQYAIAVPYFIRELGNASVVVVRRAADGLKRVGDDRAIPALINALVTTHRYKVRVRDTSGTIGFSTGGSFGTPQPTLPPQIEAMLRAGQLPNGVIVTEPEQRVRTKVITVKYTHQNREVLAALQRITGASYGYSKRDWQLWLASTKNSSGVKSP